MKTANPVSFLCAVDQHGSNHYSVVMSASERKVAELALKSKELDQNEVWSETRKLQRVFAASNDHNFQTLVELIPWLSDVS